MTEVLLLDERTGAAAARLAGAVDRRPVEAVHRVVVRDPVVGAPAAARHLQLGDVVEHPPRSVDLPRAVALHVIGEPDARRDLLGPAEVHAGTGRLVERRNVFALRAHAGVQRELAVQRPGVLQEDAFVVGVDLANRCLLYTSPSPTRLLSISYAVFCLK